MNLKKKILLILTGKETEAEIAGKVSAQAIEKVYVCPIEYRARSLGKSLLTRLADDGLNVEVVDFVELFNKRSFDYKKDFIDFIHQVGEKKLSPGASLKEYFVYPQENFSLWWFSLIAEKNPCKSPAFTIFSKVLTICHLQKELGCEEIWVGSSSGIVAKLLTQLENRVVFLKKGEPDTAVSSLRIFAVEMLRAGMFAVSLLKKILDVRGLKKELSQQKQRLSQCGTAIFTMFPFLNEKEAEEGKFINISYGSLQAAMERNQTKGLAWLGIYTSINSHSWKKAISFAEKLKAKNTFFLVEEWFSIKDFLHIIKMYFVFAFRFLKQWKNCKKIFVYEDTKTQAAIDFWPVFRHDLVSSFFGKILIWRLTDFTMFSNIVEHLPAKTKVLYFSEMHGWEKAINLACQKRKDVTCVGIQHSIVPLLLLNYFDHPKDLQHGDYVQHSPRPDFLGCIGRITQQMFAENNWPRERLFILGGFRFPSLKAKPLIVESQSKTKNQIVVAFSIITVEIKEMLRLLFEAFNDEKLDVAILLKSHPCTPVANIAKEMKLKLNPKVFQFTDRSLQDIVPQSKGMIVKESSSAFWAIQHELPIIVPLLYNIVDLSPLSGVSKIPIYVKTSEELFSAVKEVVAGNRKVDPQAYQRFFSDYMDIYPDDNQYYHNLINAIEHQEVASR